MVENCDMNCKSCDEVESCDNPEKKVEDNLDKKLKENMSKIKHKLLVLSNKGGVGKSSIDINMVNSTDEGKPYIFQYKDSETAQAFNKVVGLILAQMK